VDTTSEKEYSDLMASNRRPTTSYSCKTPKAFHDGPMGVGRIFSKGANGGFSQGKGPKVVKSHFSLSKLWKQLFCAKHVAGKREIFKSRWGQGPLPPPSDTHGWTWPYSFTRSASHAYTSLAYSKDFSKIC